MTLIIELFLYLLSLYLIFGVAFGVYFIIYGASKIDPILAETRKRVRILLIPGIIAVGLSLIAMQRLVDSREDI